MWKISFLILLLLSFCTQKKSLPYYNTADFTPHWTNSFQIKHHIGSFEFLNQNGEMITQENLKGKIHVANFFFTSCPSICPKMTEQFINLQNHFKNDASILLVSYSVMPWMDTVAILNEYALRNGIDGKKWHLLTGKQSEIYQLARQSYFAEKEIGYTKDSSEFLHTEYFFLVDQELQIRGLYHGTLAYDTRKIIDDIKKLQSEN